MESKDSLRDLNLAAARPFIEYPPTPWWYPALMGGYFAATVSAILLFASGHRFEAIGVLAGAIIALGLFFRWYRSRWGTWPQMSEAPPEIRRAYRIALAGASVAVLLAVAVTLLSPPVVAVVATFVVFTTSVWAYERRVYPSACVAVRERLA